MFTQTYIHILSILPLIVREREREREREILNLSDLNFDILVILTFKYNNIHFITLLIQTLKQSDKSYIFL